MVFFQVATCFDLVRSSSGWYSVTLTKENIKFHYPKNVIFSEKLIFQLVQVVKKSGLKQITLIGVRQYVIVARRSTPLCFMPKYAVDRVACSHFQMKLCNCDFGLIPAAVCTVHNTDWEELELIIFYISLFTIHTHIFSTFQIPFIPETVGCITHNILEAAFHNFANETPDAAASTWYFQYTINVFFFIIFQNVAICPKTVFMFAPCINDNHFIIKLMHNI